jgi:ribosomal protein S27AE
MGEEKPPRENRVTCPRCGASIVLGAVQRDVRLDHYEGVCHGCNRLVMLSVTPRATKAKPA